MIRNGSANARLGLAVGQLVGGLALVVGGATGELLGGAVSVSGIGALAGVPAMAVSATLITGGVGNIAAGIQGATQSLMSSGSGSGGAPKAAGSGGGAGPRRPSAAQRDQTFERSKDAAGKPRCTYCGKEITREPGRPNTYEADHRTPYSRGGSTTNENLEPSCRTCNRSKGAQTPEEWEGP